GGGSAARFAALVPTSVRRAVLSSAVRARDDVVSVAPDRDARLLRIAPSSLCAIRIARTGSLLATARGRAQIQRAAGHGPSADAAAAAERPRKHPVVASVRSARDARCLQTARAGPIALTRSPARRRRECRAVRMWRACWHRSADAIDSAPFLLRAACN